MTTSLEVTMISKLAGTFEKTDEVNPGEQELDTTDQLIFTNGTGTSVTSPQADQVWGPKMRTIAASSNDDLDLEGGLSDIFGQTINPAKVKGLRITAAVGNTNNVVVGNAAANGVQLGFGAVTHTWAIPPGGRLEVTFPGTGWTTTAGTADILRIANSGAGTSVTYTITLIMASA